MFEGWRDKWIYQLPYVIQNTLPYKGVLYPKTQNQKLTWKSRSRDSDRVFKLRYHSEKEDQWNSTGFERTQIA